MIDGSKMGLMRLRNCQFSKYLERCKPWGFQVFSKGIRIICLEGNKVWKVMAKFVNNLRSYKNITKNFITF